MNTTPWFAIVNPRASSGKSVKIWNGVCDRMINENIGIITANTNCPNHATDLAASAVQKGYRKFIGVGGDGTINEIVNGLLKQREVPSHEIILTQFPIGTGNDWCRSLSIPLNPDAVISLIKNEMTMRHDVGLAHYQHNSSKQSRYFINMAGMGFDAYVAQKANMAKQQGRSSSFSYITSLLASLFQYHSSNADLKIDDNPHHLRLFSMNAAIGRFSGGGMMPAPKAIPNDGVLDFTIIQDMSKLDVLRNIKGLFDGSFITHPKVHRATGMRMSLDSDPPIGLELDGESAGQSPITIEIVPNALQVIIPEKIF